MHQLAKLSFAKENPTTKYVHPAAIFRDFVTRTDSIVQYDKNAIQVKNVLGEQIGHLPRKVAEKFAPYIVRATYYQL